MATDQTFVDFVVGQIDDVSPVTAKKMFGEYGLFCEGRMFAMICDNKLFFKPTAGGRAFIGNVKEAAPYPGAKLSFLIEEQVEDREWLSQLVRISVKEIPEPKRRKRKK